MIEIYHINDKNFVDENTISWDLVDKRYLDAKMSHDENKKINVVTELFNEGNYVLVAKVDTKNLEEAFSKTNNIDTNWQENKGVESLFDKGRSSSVGDVFKDENGKYHLVANMGFVELHEIIEKKQKFKP